MSIIRKWCWDPLILVLKGPLFILKEWLLWTQEAFRYYQNPAFRKADLKLVARHGLRPPTWVYLNDYTHREPYGETPLSAYAWLLTTIPNAHNLKWVEPGCGRGRGVFWLASHLKPEQPIPQQVTGIDLQSDFIQQARTIQQATPTLSCHFIYGDFLNTDYQPYNIVFLYASCTSDLSLTDLAVKLLRLTKGSWVASVSFPITEYAIGGTFQLHEEHEISMIWGKTTVYVCKRTDFLPF